MARVEDLDELRGRVSLGAGAEGGGSTDGTA